jgi:septal ring factor EnvC (AmiA/AmiB activator)
MLRAATTATKASCAAFAVALAVLGGLMLGLRSAPARAVSIGELQQQITAGRSRISSLAGAVGAYSTQLTRLSTSITSLQNQISRLEVDISAKEAELTKLRIELTLAHNRLTRSEAFEAHAESVLAKQLVNSYESDQPDLVTIVLESNGFQDLLDSRLRSGSRTMTCRSSRPSGSPAGKWPVRPSVSARSRFASRRSRRWSGASATLWLLRGRA